MLNIAICDDEKEFLDFEEEKIKQCCERNSLECNIRKFNSPLNLVEIMKRNTQPFDIVFFDINMDELNGVDAVETVREHNKSCIIIFLTSLPEYSIKTIRLEPHRYMIKKEFSKELDEAILTAQSKVLMAEKCFSMKGRDGVIQVPLSSIIYFECTGRTITAVMFNGKCEFYSTLSKLEEELREDGFVVCYKGYLVNSKYITRISSDLKNIELRNGSEIPISRSYIVNVKDFILGKYGVDF